MAIFNCVGGGANMSSIMGTSDIWANDTTYAVNDYKIYANTLYRCILAHTTSTATTILPTNSTYWSAVSLKELSNAQRTITYDYESYNTSIFTKSTGTSGWQGANNILVYGGHCVQCNIFGQISAYGFVATIPSTLRPKRAIGVGTDSSVYINYELGRIYITSGQALNTDFNLSMSYII